MTANAEPTTRACTRCKAEKPLTEFHRSKTGKYGRAAQCRTCFAALYRAARCYAPPPEKRCFTCQEVKSASEFFANAIRADGLDSYCKTCHGRMPSRSAQARRAYRERLAAEAGRKCRVRPRRLTLEAKEARAKAAQARREAKRIADEKARAERIAAKPWTDRSLSRAERLALRYRLDPEFNLHERIRLQVKKQRRGGKIPDHIRAALMREGAAPPKLEATLGYSISGLRRHIERQFAKGMSWAKFFDGSIHIDHIIPIAAFDLSEPDAIRRAWAMPNLRPMWADENIYKGAERVLLL